MSRLLRLLALAVSVAMIGLVGGVTAGSATAAPPDGKGRTVQVHGKASNGGNFAGKYVVNSFENRDGQVFAVGDLTGNLTNPGQGAPQQVDQAGVAMPVNLQQSTGSCQILDLVLGPLSLDLLGLQVNLDTVHLNITAQPGAGNLLGNLLCAVAGLLDNPAANLAQLVNLLNQILGAL